MPMLDSERLAARAYHSVIESIAEIQQRMVMRKLLIQEFGENALPTERLLRDGRSVLNSAAEHMLRAQAGERERLNDLLSTARRLEAIFAEKEHADLEAFAQWFAERYRKEHAPAKGGKDARKVRDK